MINSANNLRDTFLNNTNNSMTLSKHRQELFSKIKGKPGTFSKDIKLELD